MIEKRKNSGTVYSWFDENQDNGHLKILAGVRGAGKTHALEKIRRKLTTGGKTVVSVDFEAPENRQVKTCRDALKLLDLDSRPGEKKHVFLDEVGYLPDHRKLLGVLFADKECRILLSTSNARVLHPDCLGYFSGCYTRYDLFPDPARTRSAAELDSVWNKAFVRDVLGGNSLADAYAEERIAEYFADHVGEFISSRKVADDVNFAGYRIAHVTAGQYMQLLEDAFLVEKVPQWDAFSASASMRRFAYFFTDTELRDYFFRSTGGQANERKALNAAYVALRRDFRCPVYVASRTDDADADFVTVEGTSAQFWKADRREHGLYSHVGRETK